MKIAYWLGFIVCGGVSCWATAESLCLLSNWHIVLCYLITIAFFIIASFGTKMIVDSFGHDVNHPLLQLLGGTILVIIFWLICSMPTNTHTFFMSQQGKELAIQDINTTNKYLTYLKNYSGTIDLEFQRYCEVLDKDVSTLKNQLYEEICGKENRGNGDRAKGMVRNFNTKYGTDIEELSALSKRNPERAYKSYESAIDNKVETLKIDKAAELVGSSGRESIEEMKKKADMHIKRLDKIKEGLGNGDLKVTNLDDLNNINRELTESYTLIKSHSDIAPLEPADKAKYTAEKIITDTKRATNVFDMVGDYWNGRYNGFGLGWWILFAVLVDIAAFIFFYLATRRDDLF